MPNCRICKSDNLISVLNLGEQYLSEFRSDDIKPPKFPLELTICSDCKQVQLRDTVPQKLLYTDNYGYRSGINNTMRKHLQSLVFDVMKRMGDNLKQGDNVVDAGSNDGTLLKNYPSYLNRYGYDLVPKFAKDYEGTGIVFVNEPFGAVHSQYPKFKIITAISMFYDLDDPIKFLQSLKDSLEGKGIIVIQQNYLLEMLRINGFDNIGFEHLTYSSVNGMERMCDKVGLEIFDLQINDLNGGSFRTYICYKGDYKVKRSVKKQLDYELGYGLESLECYKEFAERVYRVRDEIRSLIVGLADKGMTTGVVGCSTRGNTLLQYCGLDSELICKGIERNPEKYGKKIASCGIPIVDEAEGFENPPDYLLVLPWFFSVEMTRRYRSYLRNGGKLIFPLPKLEVVGR